MTSTIKPSSIVHTRAQVEAMADDIDRVLAYAAKDDNKLRQAAAMLRELAGACR